MTSRDELIEKAAKAMYRMTNSLSVSGARDLARAALAVFEQENTPREAPSTDERDESCEWCDEQARGLAEWQGDGQAHPSCGGHGFNFEPFSISGLPSRGDWETLTLIVRDVHNYDGRAEWLSLSGADAGRIADAILAAGFRRPEASNVSEPGVTDISTGQMSVSEPQAEPSERAQMGEAWGSYYRAGMTQAESRAFKAGWRAAFKAGGEG